MRNRGDPKQQTTENVFFSSKQMHETYSYFQFECPWRAPILVRHICSIGPHWPAFIVGTKL